MKTRIASEIMTKTLVTGTEEMSLIEAMRLLVEHGIGCLPIVDGERNLLGVITAYDMMNSAASGEAERTLVGDVMSRQVFSYPSNTDLATIVNGCLSKRIHRVPIVDGSKLVGLISRRDIMREILTLYEGRPTASD